MPTMINRESSDYENPKRNPQYHEPYLPPKKVATVRTPMEQLEYDVDRILKELKSILLKKQEDYGPLNISLAPGGPLNGLRVRMYDKLARFSHLYEKGSDTPNYESLHDTFVDLANYAIIGILVQNGQWEGLPNDTKSGGAQ